MPNCKKHKLLKIIFFFLFFLGCFLAKKALAAFPYKANYYLGELPGVSTEMLAKYDLLILSPAQIHTHKSIIKKIKSLNSDVIILAYVPSQSFNNTYWHSDVVFRNLKPIKDEWWLKDPGGQVISSWTGILNINLAPSWSEHLVDFISNNILKNQNIDGVFLDMVSENISWINGGNVDMNNDGQKDIPASADALWLERTKYLLELARKKIPAKYYIVINGSSNPSLQSFVNGRMFETFPTPWENDGSWGTVMNNWARNKKINFTPQLTVINSNTNNSGHNGDYQKMRFGLASALLEDGYFSFDHGDQNHGQAWWYDEYDVDLGVPSGKSASNKNSVQYNGDVWRRDFQNGLALVNSGNKTETVALNGDYEKIHGAQDKKINDGSIVSEVKIKSNDGLVLLKTISTLQNVLFTNGYFVRFFRPTGEKVRNGFFVFEEKYKGGEQVAHLDLNGDDKIDTVLVRKNQILAWRHDGKLMLREYPYGANYKGELKVALGDIDGNEKFEIYIGPEYGYPVPIKVYSVYGSKLRPDWYPFGNKYNGGYSLAITSYISGKSGKLVIAKGQGFSPKVQIYDDSFNLLNDFLAYENTFKGGVNVAAGDLDGNGIDELIVGPGKGKKPIIKVFSEDGKELYQGFAAYTAFNEPGIDVRAADVDFDGKEDIITLSSGL